MYSSAEMDGSKLNGSKFYRTRSIASSPLESKCIAVNPLTPSNRRRYDTVTTLSHRLISIRRVEEVGAINRTSQSMTNTDNSTLLRGHVHLNLRTVLQKAAKNFIVHKFQTGLLKKNLIIEPRDKTICLSWFTGQAKQRVSVSLVGKDVPHIGLQKFANLLRRFMTAVSSLLAFFGSRL